MKNTTTAFTRLVTTFIEPKKPGRKLYFKKLSFTSLYVIMAFLTLISFTYVGYFKFENLTLDVNLLETKTFFYTFFAVVAFLVIFIIKPSIVNRALYYTIPLLMLALILSYWPSKLPTNMVVSLISSIALAMGMGLIFSAAILAFIYTLNASERLVVSFLFITAGLLYFFTERLMSSITPWLGDFVLPLTVLIGLYVIIFFVDKADFSKITFKEEEVSLLAVIFVTVFAICFLMNEAIYAAVKENISKNYRLFSDFNFYIGSFIALILTLALYLWNRYTLLILSLIWFFASWFSYQLGVLFLLSNQKMFFLNLMTIVIGFVSSMGYITIALLIGKVFEDKVNNRILKIVSVFVMFSFLSSRFLSIAIQQIDLALVLSVMQIVFFILTAIMTTFWFKSLTKSRSASEPQPEVQDNKTNEPDYINPFDTLTTKELLVFEQLLSGLTLRQIAGELKMKYDTVNFHYKNIYRKLEVNSKIELIIRYGQHR